LIQTAFSQKIGLDKIAGGVPARVLERRDLILIHWDIEKSGYLPLKSNLCAVVVHLAVIEHIEPERVIPLLREMARILQDNGTLIITTPAAWTDRLLRFMARLGLVSAVEIAEHKAAYSRRQLVDLLAQVFDRAQIQAGYFEFGMNIWAVAKKHTGFRGIAGEL
jgi:SAM-dependent methyltransferase